MVNIFIFRCPNRSGVGAIDKADRSEQVFKTKMIFLKNLKKFLSLFHGGLYEKVIIFGVLDDF